MQEQDELRTVSRASARKRNEEDAILEEQRFADKFMKAELRESRALCSSMRVKLKFYEDEVDRLRQSISIPV